MASYANQSQGLRVRFGVDQNQIRMDMAVTMVFPFTAQCMVAKLLRQWLIVAQLP